MPFSRTAFKRLAINPPNEINNGDITKLGRARLVNGNSRPVFIGNTLEGFIDLFRVTVDFGPLYRQLAKIGDADRRHHLTGERCHQILAVIIGFDINLRLACQRKVVAFDRLLGPFIQRRLDRLAAHLITKA